MPGCAVRKTAFSSPSVMGMILAPARRQDQLEERLKLSALPYGRSGPSVCFNSLPFSRGPRSITRWLPSARVTVFGRRICRGHKVWPEVRMRRPVWSQRKLSFARTAELPALPAFLTRPVTSSAIGKNHRHAEARRRPFLVVNASSLNSMQ